MRWRKRSAIAGDNLYLFTAEYRYHVPRAFAIEEEPRQLFGQPFRYAPQYVYGRPDWDLILKAFVDVGFVEINDPLFFEVDDETLDRYNIPERVVRLAQPDFGPSKRKSNRRRTFLDLPITWTPTTWIFHKNGQLAFAFNHGEVDLDMMRTFLDALEKDW